MTRPLDLGLLAALSATAVSAGPAAKAEKAHAFDGKWSIEVITERGSCDRAYRYGIRIENGQARYDGGTDFTVSGQVTGNGRVKGSIARGADRADVVGALDGQFGNGTWQTAGATACGGVWNAERRG
ncbi:hypothetical protein ACFQ12_12030 [Methylobacterium trifolii]